MATSSSQSESREKNTGEEMDAAVETGEGASAENGCEDEKKKGARSRDEAEDPFKKPALFAAPSLAIKRGAAVVPSKPTEQDPGGEKEPLKSHSSGGGAPPDDTPKGDVTEENKTPETAREGETSSDDEETVGAPVKTRQDVKPRVLPARGPPPPPPPPPPGDFKPHPALPYTEPPWGGLATDIPYALEILKNGTIVDKVPLTQRSYFVVGRLPVCDVSLEHPSISRYHAVIQYRGQAGGEEEEEEEDAGGEEEAAGGGEEAAVGEGRGFYIHDLGSTHGTFVNKNKVPPKTYIRLHVGHVLKFGGSTRLFILQGPEFDEEAESDLTVTELRERAQKQRAALEKRMTGEGSDNDGDEEEEEKEGEEKSDKGKGKKTGDDSGCSWGMGEEAAPEEDENEENPFATEFHEDQEAAYLKDPKKALQGFYDREGEELEFEYEDKNHGTWLCRIKLPVDDAMGRQLVAEVTHTGKKKEAAIQCSLEACRILEARGLLRQEAVSRKRKKKNWEDEDYYDSDDDTFLDRTGVVEKKRQERMKKAGKIEERPDTYDSLVAKLAEVQKDLAETQKKLGAGGRDNSNSSTEDSLDAFMSAVRSEAAMDAVDRRKLHVHMADLRKEAQRLQKLVELTRPAQMPSLQSRSDGGTSDPQKPKKALPLFGAMKGGSKFKLKTGTIGKLPPKRPNLPAELFNMKGLPPGGEEEEEEEDEEEAEEDAENSNKECENIGDGRTEPRHRSGGSPSQECSSSSEHQGEQPAPSPKPKGQSQNQRRDEGSAEPVDQVPTPGVKKSQAPSRPDPKGVEEGEPAAQNSSKKSVKKKGPSRPPAPLSKQYPEDDPDYCVWVPPTDQTGDGRTHLNDKYGY